MRTLVFNKINQPSEMLEMGTSKTKTCKLVKQKRKETKTKTSPNMLEMCGLSRGQVKQKLVKQSK
jgi:hypothetical protein